MVMANHDDGQAPGRALVERMASRDFETGKRATRPCYFSGDLGPLEVSAEEWDGVSVWVGHIPQRGICRKDGKDVVFHPSGGAGHSSGSARATSEIFAAMYTLSDELVGLLTADGSGLDLSPGLGAVCPEPENGSWALVTFKRREDAESLYASGLRLTSPPEDLHLKRTIDAAAAKDMLEQVRCQEKNLHFLLKNLEFLFKNLHFPIKNLHFNIISGGHARAREPRDVRVFI